MVVPLGELVEIAFSGRRTLSTCHSAWFDR